MSLTNFPRILVIRNPISGSRRAALLEHVLGRLRATGCAVELCNTGKRGDLYARILIKLPNELNKKQKGLIEELAETGL